MKQGNWFDGLNKFEQLARELLWLPGMRVLEVASSPSSFELAKLLELAFFHLELSPEQLEASRALAAKREVNAQSALWEERAQALGAWPPLDALVIRNLCGLPLETLKPLLGKLSCSGSLLLTWPIRLGVVSEAWAQRWSQPLWTPNELLYALRGLGFEAMAFESSPFVPEGGNAEAMLGEAEGASEADLRLTAYALTAATSQPSGQARFKAE